MARRAVVRLLRRWSSSASEGREAVAASERRSTPGFVRVRKDKGKGFEAEKHEAEVDSTIARVIGSDWGDRSHQAVSLPMRLYWLVFGVVLLNGVYTYLAGKDESFLVDKLKKKADEKMGVVEKQNEFEEMAEKVQEVKAVEQVKTVEKSVPTTQPTSMLGPGSVSTGMPFFSPAVTSASSARRVKTKSELEQQLAQLRLQQERLRRQVSSTSGSLKEELEHQVRMIDIQKDQVKRMIKGL